MARFHIEYKSIHPFIDGNGRSGRLLVNLELMKAGFPPIDIKFADRISYYNAFDEYHSNNNEFDDITLKCTTNPINHIL